MIGPDSRNRLVHVITRLIRGGAQLALLGLCAELQTDFDVRVICGPDEGLEGSIRREVADVVPVTVVPTLRREIHPLQDAEAGLALRRIFHRLRPDIIHTHSSKAGIVGRWAGTQTEAALVHTVHGWGHTPRDPRWRRGMFIGLERRAARHTDALVAVSGDVRDEGLRCRIGAPSKYHVIPAFVDLRSRVEDFASARAWARGQLQLDPSVETVGWIGRFVPQKDPETLVRAVQRILRHRPRAHAVLVGDGPLRTQSEQRFERSDVAGRVRFAGLRSEARSLLPAFDVLVHVSQWEGQPLVVQEAIAERIPVVATRVTGVDELVIPGRTGYVLTPGDSAGIAEGAQSILDDPALRAPLPMDVAARLVEGHGRDASLAGHLALYGRMLGSST